MPSFFINRVHPGWSEYHQNQWGYDALFILPYCIAAFLALVIGLIVAPRLAGKSYWHFLVAMGMILSAMGISDLLSVWHNSGSFFHADMLWNLRHVAVSAVISAGCVGMSRLGS